MFRSEYIIRRYEKADGEGYRLFRDNPIRLSIQSLNTRELEALPEGERSARRVKSFSSSEIRTVNQREEIPADRLYYQGEWYECEQASRWAHTPLAHWEGQWVVLPEGEQQEAPEVVL